MFPSLVSTLTRHGLRNEGHAETPDFSVSTSPPCLCHGKSVIQALLYSFTFWRLIASGLMFFSAVSRVTSFETDDSVGAGRQKEKKTEIRLRYIDAVRSRTKTEREKSYIKADLSKQKWNWPVSCSQHSYFGTRPFEEIWYNRTGWLGVRHQVTYHSRRGWGRGACWQWKISLLLCMLRVRRLVWQWTVTVLLADQHRFHLLLDSSTFTSCQNNGHVDWGPLNERRRRRPRVQSISSKSHKVLSFSR